MLSGFNTNIRHRTILFHVQTEDSGRAHPHIISHLYYGGTILSSEKSGYAELMNGGELSDDAIEDSVRKRMQEQHKEMLRELRRGEFDEVILERLGDAIFPAGSEKDLAVAKEAEKEVEEIELLEEEVIEPEPPDAVPEPVAAAVEPVESGDAPPAESSSRPSPPPSIPRGKRVSAGSKALAQIGAKPAAKKDDESQEKDDESQEFGESVVSKKPLDEVVFDFLVENARKKPSSK